MIANAARTLVQEFVDYHAEQFQFPERFLGPPQLVGQGTELLGGEPLDVDFFEQLARGNDRDAKWLLPRRNAARRLGDEWVFAPPKSVSLIALVGGDERVIALGQEKVMPQVMIALEKAVATRVRAGGANHSELTGILVAALLPHAVSRLGDPLLHWHAPLFNLTWNTRKDRWQAADFTFVYERRAFWEALFQAFWCEGLQALGYDLDFDERSYEIRGIEPEVLQRFSKRKDEIEAEVERREASGEVVSPRAVGYIAGAGRQDKTITVAPGELARGWQLEAGEYWPQIERVVAEARQRSTERSRISATEGERVVRDWVIGGEAEIFARESARSEHEILATLLLALRGAAAPAQILPGFRYAQKRGLLPTASGRWTSVAAVRTDRRILQFAGLEPYAACALGTPKAALALPVNDVLRSRRRVLLLQTPGVNAGKAWAKRAAIFWRDLERGLAVWPEGFSRSCDAGSAGKDAAAIFGQAEIVIVREAHHLRRDLLERLLAFAAERSRRLLIAGDIAEGGVMQLLARESTAALYSATQSQAELAAERAAFHRSVERREALARGEPEEALALVGPNHRIESVSRESILARVAQGLVEALTRRVTAAAIAPRGQVAAMNEAVREQAIKAGVIGGAQELKRPERLAPPPDGAIELRRGDILIPRRARGGVYAGDHLVVLEVREPFGLGEAPPVQVVRVNGDECELAPEVVVGCDAFRFRQGELRVGERVRALCRIEEVVADAERGEKGKRITAGQIVTIEAVRGDQIVIGGRIYAAAQACFEPAYVFAPERLPLSPKPKILYLSLEPATPLPRTVVQWLRSAKECVVVTLDRLALLAAWRERRRRRFEVSEAHAEELCVRGRLRAAAAKQRAKSLAQHVALQLAQKSLTEETLPTSDQQEDVIARPTTTTETPPPLEGRTEREATETNQTKNGENSAQKLSPPKAQPAKPATNTHEPT